MSGEERGRPDGGRCWHECGAAACWRVGNCGPLSGVYPGNRWPAALSEPAPVLCSSRECEAAGVPAIWSGRFRNLWNPEHDGPAAFCLECSAAGVMGGFFEPAPWTSAAVRVVVERQG